MRRTVVAGVIVALASSASLASASSGLIDFENQTLGPAPSLSATDPSLPSPVIFTTADGSDLTVADLSMVSGAITFGSRSIEASSPILIEFPTAVSSVSVEAGHDDGNNYSLSLLAFDNSSAMGSALGSDTESLPAVGTFFNSTDLEVDHSGILSAIISGGSSGVYFDNVGFTTGAVGVQAVPLPSSLKMFSVGAVFAGLIIYRNRRKAALR